MMRVLLLAAAILTFSLAKAQRKDVDDILDRSQVYKFSMGNNKNDSEYKLPFRSISVFDLRFDSSAIGYVRDGDGSKRFSKIVLQETWTTLFNNYFADQMDPAAKEDLLICIKSFWIQEGNDLDKHIERTNSIFNAEEGSASIINVDVYLQKDSLCQALLRMDTTYSYYNRIHKTQLESFLTCPFDSLLSNLNKIDLSTIRDKKRKIPLQEIRKYYEERFQLRSLHEPLKKGIYTSYENFKKNIAQVTEFHFDRDKHTDELYTVKNGERELLTDYWGFFDGEKLFIKVGFSAYPAKREMNSFYIFGAKHLKNKLGSANRPGDLSRFNKMTRYERLLQLDMDKGEFY